MKRCLNQNLGWILFLLAFFIPCNIHALEGELGNFSIPLFSDEGTGLGIVKGESAKFLNENDIEIIKAIGEISTPEFLNPWNLKMSQCIFKKQRNCIVTDHPATLETLGLTIDGDGMEWAISKSRITFFKNVTLNLNAALFRTKKS
jgi:hypothetical protein